MNCNRWLLSGLLSLTVVIGLAAALNAGEEASEELVELAVSLLQDEDKDVRALALDQVRTEAPGEAATKEFAAQLPKLSPDAQAALLDALADRGDAAARPAVLAMLSASRDEPVRAAAIAALGALGDAADARLLVQLLSAASDAEQAAARTSLVRLRGEAVPAAIVAEMKRATPLVRVALIEILAARRALDAIPDLLSAAVDADVATRAAAMSALGQLAGPEDIPGMVRGVLKSQDGPERQAAERSVAAVCGRIANAEKRAQPLLAAMNKLEEADQTAMLPTLGRIGGPEALKIIEAAIADPRRQRHDMGVRALSNWPTASVAPRLIELASSDKHPEHQRTALRALIRVAPLPGQQDSRKLELLQKAMTMSTRDEERNLVLERARAIRTVESLRFVAAFMDQPKYAEQACETVIELAHHRELRESAKSEFERALDKVIQSTSDATLIERANRYKNGQTWARPIVSASP